MHYLHKVLVHIPECIDLGSTREEQINDIKCFAESATEDYLYQAFDWRETDTAGRWEEEYPQQVYFASDNLEWFINEINQATQSQKDEIDSHLRQLSFLDIKNMQEFIDRAYKAQEEYDKSVDAINENHLYRFLRIAQLLYGEYICCSFIYDTANSSARIYPSRLDDVRANPDEWALVMFDYHN